VNGSIDQRSNDQYSYFGAFWSQTGSVQAAYWTTILVGPQGKTSLDCILNKGLLKGDFKPQASVLLARVICEGVICEGVTGAALPELGSRRTC